MPSSNQFGEVLARVEGATGPDRKIDATLFRIDKPDMVAARPWGGFIEAQERGEDDFMVVPRYTSSIDAALALVERKLPGWGCASLSWHTGGKSPVFRIERSHPTNIEVAAEGHTRPLAILAALLRALANQETDRGNG